MIYSAVAKFLKRTGNTLYESLSNIKNNYSSEKLSAICKPNAVIYKKKENIMYNLNFHRNVRLNTRISINKI